MEFKYRQNAPCWRESLVERVPRLATRGARLDLLAVLGIDAAINQLDATLPTPIAELLLVLVRTGMVRHVLEARALRVAEPAHDVQTCGSMGRIKRLE